MSEKDFGTNSVVDQNTTMKSNQDGQDLSEQRRNPRPRSQNILELSDQERGFTPQDLSLIHIYTGVSAPSAFFFCSTNAFSLL